MSVWIPIPRTLFSGNSTQQTTTKAHDALLLLLVSIYSATNHQAPPHLNRSYLPTHLPMQIIVLIHRSLLRYHERLNCCNGTQKRRRYLYIFKGCYLLAILCSVLFMNTHRSSSCEHSLIHLIVINKSILYTKRRNFLSPSAILNCNLQYKFGSVVFTEVNRKPLPQRRWLRIRRKWLIRE